MSSNLSLTKEEKEEITRNKKRILFKQIPTFILDIDEEEKEKKIEVKRDVINKLSLRPLESFHKIDSKREKKEEDKKDRKEIIEKLKRHIPKEKLTL